jgi:hypothetical protein
LSVNEPVSILETSKRELDESGALWEELELVLELEPFLLELELFLLDELESSS